MADPNRIHAGAELEIVAGDGHQRRAGLHVSSPDADIGACLERDGARGLDLAADFGAGAVNSAVVGAP